MKREDLEALGLSKEQIDKVCDLNNADVAPLKKELETAQEDLEAEQGKTEEHTRTIEGLKDDLKQFQDVDVSAMTQKITDLESALAQHDEQHRQELADRDFQNLVKESITGAGGRNHKAIMALLDMDKLKDSKNQKEDIAAELKELAAAEDSKMLFAESTQAAGSGHLIGNVRKGTATTATTLGSAIAEHYGV